MRRSLLLLVGRGAVPGRQRVDPDDLEALVAVKGGSGGGVFVATEETAHDIVITPVGELDLAFAPTLLASIREAIAAAPRRIVLDFGSLSFLDSGGCDMLALACQEARGAGIRIAMYEEMALRVRRVLAVTMLLSMFDPVWSLSTR